MFWFRTTRQDSARAALSTTQQSGIPSFSQCFSVFCSLEWNEWSLENVVLPKTSFKVWTIGNNPFWLVPYAFRTQQFYKLRIRFIKYISTTMYGGAFGHYTWVYVLITNRLKSTTQFGSNTSKTTNVSRLVFSFKYDYCSGQTQIVLISDFSEIPKFLWLIEIIF